MVEILLNLQEEYIFFAPELLRIELLRYTEKLQKASKLTYEQIDEASYRVMERLILVSEELIDHASWHKAYELTKDIDEDDTPFVALSLALDAKLWTGDKKLMIGLKNKGSDIAVTAKELMDYLKNKGGY